MEYDFDIAVVGAGAGGGTLAARCASRGLNVLLVERGPGHTKHLSFDEQSVLVNKRPYDDRPIVVNGESRRLYMGGLLGGGTSVYGGVMLRPSRADFQPGRFYGERLERCLWDWPVEYDEFRPWFSEVERLYCVGSSGEAFPEPLEAPATDASPVATDLAPMNRRLVNAGRSIGMQAFSLPLAIDSTQCLRCDQCAGFPCPTSARRSSAHLVQERRLSGDSLTVWSNTEAEVLLRGTGEQLEGLRLRQRLTGTKRTIRARRYVLAAGAIGSSVLLQRSGFEHPMIGRNYMMHYSPLAVAVFAGRTGAADSFIKQLGFADCYLGTNDVPEKMGVIQSLPAPGPLMLAKFGLGWLPQWMRNQLRARLLPLAGIVEDLPDSNNKVVCRDNTIELTHHFSDFDRLRGQAMMKQMKALLKAAGALHVVTKELPSVEHVAHQCGTLRFGTSALHAVADTECRLFEQEDVFVADGSILPTSLGVGPSLLIAANALRVADVIVREIGAKPAAALN